jgi:hypothetical protein
MSDRDVYDIKNEVLAIGLPGTRAEATELKEKCQRLQKELRDMMKPLRRNQWSYVADYVDRELTGLIARFTKAENDERLREDEDDFS